MEAGEHNIGVPLEIVLLLLAIAAAVGGLFVARALYGGERGLEGERALTGRFPALHRLLANKYYVDEIYDRLIVRPLAALARFFWKGVDTFLIDGAIHTGAWTTQMAGEVGRFSTTGNVRNYALYFFAGVVVLFLWLIF